MFDEHISHFSTYHYQYSAKFHSAHTPKNVSPFFPLIAFAIEIAKWRYHMWVCVQSIGENNWDMIWHYYQVDMYILDGVKLLSFIQLSMQWCWNLIQFNFIVNFQIKFSTIIIRHLIVSSIKWWCLKQQHISDHSH